MQNDSFGIEILEDGTIKMITSKVGAANHSNAEQFFRQVARLSGGETTRTRRQDAPHQHTHSHGHGKEHSHG